jgi:hypothetical protein
VPDAVFISYASENRDDALRYVEALKRRDISIWIDQERIQPSDALVAQISDGLAGAKVALVLFSRHYAEKVWTREEMAALVYAAVVSAERKVLCVRLDDTPLPPLLAHRVWVKHPAFSNVADMAHTLLTGGVSKSGAESVQPIAQRSIAPRELDVDTVEAVAREVVSASSKVQTIGGVLEVSTNGQRFTIVLNQGLLGRDMLAEIRSRLEVADIHRAYIRDLREELAEGALGKFKTGFRLSLDRKLESLEESRRLIREWVEAVTVRAQMTA